MVLERAKAFKGFPWIPTIHLPPAFTSESKPANRAQGRCSRAKYSRDCISWSRDNVRLNSKVSRLP